MKKAVVGFGWFFFFFFFFFRGGGGGEGVDTVGLLSTEKVDKNNNNSQKRIQWKSKIFASTEVKLN